MQKVKTHIEYSFFHFPPNECFGLCCQSTSHSLGEKHITSMNCKTNKNYVGIWVMNSIQSYDKLLVMTYIIRKFALVTIKYFIKITVLISTKLYFHFQMLEEQMKEEEIINPWQDIQSLYDLQFFICPSCPYVNNSKQDFVNHAYSNHPESDQYLRNIDDGSISDVDIPSGDYDDFKSELDCGFQEDPLHNNGLEIKIEEFEDHNNKQQQHSIVRHIDSVSGSATLVLERLKIKDIFCSLCNVYFCDLNSLLKHKENLHDDIKLEDLNSDIMTKSEIKTEEFDITTYSDQNSKIDNKENHILDDEHGDGSNYRCEHCEKECMSKKDLIFHYSTAHEDLKSFQCNHCQELFGTSKELLLHVKLKHFSNGRKEFKCKSSKKVHEDHKDYKCESCGKVFSNSSNMNRHIHTVHEGHKDYKCESCGKSFTHETSLKKHEDYKCKGVQKKSHECPECAKKFIQKGSLIRHMGIHDPDKIQCEKCNRFFSKEYYYRKHNNSKSCKPKQELVPVQCHICGKELKDKFRLKSHVKVLHDEVPEKHSCNICGKIYPYLSSVKYHVKNFHEKVKKLQCATCGKAFGEASVLKQHMYTHLDEPQFACDQCPKKFRGRKHLYTHKISVHEGRLDHVCTYCGKAFNTSGRLKRHSSVVSTYTTL